MKSTNEFCDICNIGYFLNKDKICDKITVTGCSNFIVDNPLLETNRSLLPYYLYLM